MGHVIAINHHRRQRHAGGFGDVDRVERFNEGRFYAGLEGFDHLHHQLFTALHRVRLGDHIEPGRGGVAATVRVMAHVRRAAETGKTTAGDG